MNKPSEFIAFLRRNQPLPADAQLTEADATTLDEAIRFFSQNVDDACVALFCGVVGDVDGHGVYQLIEDALRNQRRDLVVTSLCRIIRRLTDV
jgi:deoxyhypusine synthase